MPLNTLVNQNGDLIPVLYLGSASGIHLQVGSTATNTATTGFSTEVIRVTSDIGVCIKFHFSATETLAATTDHFMPANSVESFQIRKGMFLSARTTTGTATGVLGAVRISEAV